MRALPLLLLVAIAGCGGGSPPPETRPAAPEGVTGAVATAAPSRARASARALRARGLQAPGRLEVCLDGDCDGYRATLTVARSGAIAIRAAGRFELVSDGRRVRVRAEDGGVREVDALELPASDRAHRWRALSPLDLADALLPPPLPERGETHRLLDERAPEDHLVLWAAVDAAHGWTLHRRLTFDPSGRLWRRTEVFDADGRVARTVDYGAWDPHSGPPDQVAIAWPRIGIRVAFTTDGWTIDPALDRSAFLLSDDGSGAR